MTSKQRAYLRALANPLETLFQIGKGGVSENMLLQLDDLLRVRELIKLRVLETAGAPAKDLAPALAEALDAECVQVIGSRIVLFRSNPEKKDRILIPG